MGRRSSLALAAALAAASCKQPDPPAPPAPEAEARTAAEPSAAPAAAPAESTGAFRDGMQDHRVQGESKRLGITHLGTLHETAPPPPETPRAKAKRRKKDIARIKRLSGEIERANLNIEDARDKSVALKGGTAAMLTRREAGGALGPVELSSGVWAGTFGGGHEAGARVIETEAAWAEAWSLLGAEPAPGVDFASKRVAALSLGARPTGGFRARLVAVEESPAALTVRWAEDGPEAPAPRGATAPYLLVTLPRDGRAVLWKQEKDR